MVGEGLEDNTDNPDDNLRFAGRLSFNFFDTETSWFNKETNLGEKKILAIGGGFDCQSDLIIGGNEMDYKAYTVDLQLDIPLDTTAITSALSFTQIDNAVNGISWSDLTAGEDGDILTAKVGFLLYEKFQPFAHFQTIMPDASGADNTVIYGIGCNYYIKGLANKLTAEYSQVDDENHSVDIITTQAAFGF
jgi:hypothetical protein